MQQLTNKWPAEISFDVFAPDQDLLVSLTLYVCKSATFPVARSPQRFSAEIFAQ